MGTLMGARIALLEGRMSSELADLVRRHGGEPYCVPAVREASLECADQVAALMDSLASGLCSVVVFTTGAGATALFKEAERQGRLEELLTALRGATTVCRGPKPTGVLQRHGVRASVPVREPYTTADMLDALAGLDLADQGVALVHYGERNTPLAEAVQARRARLQELCLYEWLLPEDIQPLQALVREIIDGRVDAIAFTSQVQARHLFHVAAGMGAADAMARALNARTVVAAIGPTCAAALKALEVTPRVVPDHPKMGHMVMALGRYIQERLFEAETPGSSEELSYVRRTA